MKVTLLTYFLILIGSAFGQTIRTDAGYLTNTMTSRSAAMGGAFTAVPDFIESGLYNPAALSSVGIGSNILHVTFNPIGAVDAGRQYDDLSSRSDRTGSDFAAMLGILMRSVSLSPGPFQFSLILTEALPNNPNHHPQNLKTTTKSILDWNYHAASVRLKLAKQISMGATLLIFNLTSNKGEPVLQHHLGSSYGILIMPSSQLSLGVSLFNIPEAVQGMIYQHYGLEHQSVNFGVCYQPARALRLSLDFRNVSHGDSLAGNQLHGGLELQLLRFVALRTGYHRTDVAGEDVFSLGLGVEDFRNYRPSEERFVLSKILLNYALQAVRSEQDIHLIHYLTFLYRM